MRPNVYHPYAVTDPAPYERYADPAAAHGWENAYDETQRLPPVAPPGATGAPPAPAITFETFVQPSPSSPNTSGWPR
ncbi:hypothetical protein ACWCZB_25235, partial [Streptomyces sp. NPDC001500]